MKTIKFKQIGIIHSPFREPKGTPIQPAAAKGTDGTVEVFPEFSAGLKDLDGFSHIVLIYYFHKVKESSLEIKPFLDDQIHGIFSTRAPSRPNPIGISVVRLVRIEGKILWIKDLDIIDGTPVLDIKPYIPEFDSQDITKRGWLENNVSKLPTSKDDGRFTK